VPGRLALAPAIMVSEPMPDQPSRLDNLRTIRYANIDMAFYTAFVTLTTGAFMVKYVTHLGGSVKWIGFLSAVPSLFGLFQIPGAIWARRYESYKRFVTPGWLLWRLFYVPVAVLPLLSLPNPVKLWIFAACISASWFVVFLANPVFFEWLTELVPANSRGWLFGQRNMIAAAVGAAVGLGGGLVLDAYTAHPAPGQERVDDVGFAVVFGVGVLCSLIGQCFYMRMKDLRRANVVRESFAKSVLAFRVPLCDGEFRKALLFLGAFTFGLTFAGNFFADYAFKSLEMPLQLFQVAVLFHSAGNMLASKVWGFLADRYGNKPMLALAGFGMVLTPIPWIVCQPGYSFHNNAIIVGSHFFMGIIWSGVAICQFNLMLATTNPDDRANYMGVGMALQALVGGIAPIVGAAVLDRYLPASQPASAVLLSNAYKLLFLTTMGLRLASLLLIFRVHEPGARKLGEALRDLGKATPTGLLAMRRAGKTSDPSVREREIRRIGDHSLSLASDEIIRALHDPSPRVRRQAASSLASMGRNDEAVEALIHQLDEHPDLVEEETIEALGVLGDETAVSMLGAYLASPRARLGRAAAKALGKIGGPLAVSALIRAAESTDDPDVRRASLQALRILEASNASRAIEAALLDPDPSVRIAAAEAAAELKIKSAAGALRESLSRYADEASSEVAYALGVVGTKDDIDAILAEASRCQSIITRRRCLLGLASLYGVEQNFYRLILLGNIERDALIIESLKSNPEALRAFELYTSGDEVGAVAELHRLYPEAGLEPLVLAAVEDRFLLAACIVEKS